MNYFYLKKNTSTRGEVSGGRWINKKGGNMDMFSWKYWWEKKYTHDEVRELMEKIKEFNAGVIDEHLNKHVEKAFAEWVQTHI